MKQHTCHEYTYPGSNLEAVGNALGVNELVRDLFLGHNADGIFPADTNRCSVLLGGFERVFHLIQAALRRKDGDMPVIAGISTSRHCTKRLYRNHWFFFAAIQGGIDQQGEESPTGGCSSVLQREWI